MNTTEGLQKNILDATLRVFDQKGLNLYIMATSCNINFNGYSIYD